MFPGGRAELSIFRLWSQTGRNPMLGARCIFGPFRHYPGAHVGLMANTSCICFHFCGGHHVRFNSVHIITKTVFGGFSSLSI